MKNEKQEIILVFSFTLALSIFLFSSILGAGYVLDDHSVIENREELRVPSAVYKVFLMPWHQNQPQQGNYRPLTLLSYAFTLLFSESTAVMRFLNLLINSVNAVLLFLLIKMFSHKKVAYFSAIGFGILPINTGTVLSLVGRSDLLGAFFMLLSLALFFKNKHGWGALSLFLALLSKEFSIFLLPSAILLFVFLKKNKFPEIIKTSSYYILVLAPYFILRYAALGAQAFKSQGSVDSIIGPLAFVSLKERVLTGFVYFYLYLRKTFIPVDLSPDYSFNQIPVPNVQSLDFIVGLFLLLAIFCIFFKNRDFGVKTSIILFLAPFAVISNVFFVTTGTFAERWWYFPSMGLLWFVFAFVRELLKNKKPLSNYYLLFTIFSVSVFYLYVSFGQAKIWTNERELFVAAAERSPNSAWTRTNLAAVYFKEKKFDLAGKEIERSLEISRNYPAALNIYAKLKWRDGEFNEAESVFKQAIEHDLNKRNYRDLYRSLAILELDAEDYKKAESYIKEAINNLAFGDVKKSLYLDNLLLNHTSALVKNEPADLSDSEKKTLENLMIHIRGF